MGVRPFGSLVDPFHLAGQGGASILGTIDGKRCRVNRDLDAEKAAMHALIKACPALLAWGVSGNECEIEAAEDVLEFLEQAQGYAGAVAFEWPEGDALKVSRTIGAQKLSIKLTQKRDWFEVSGKIEVDEGLIVDMKGGAVAARPGAWPLRAARQWPLHRADTGFAAPAPAAGRHFRRNGGRAPPAWPRLDGRGRSRGKRRQGAGRQTLARIVGAHPGGWIAHAEGSRHA